MKFVIFLVVILTILSFSLQFRRKVNTKTKTPKYQVVDSQTTSRVTDPDTGAFTKTYQFWDKAAHDRKKFKDFLLSENKPITDVFDKVHEYLGGDGKSHFKTDLKYLVVTVVGSYTRPFIKILNHEMLAFCAHRRVTDDEEYNAYYFMLDRGSSNGHQDLGTRVSLYVLGQELKGRPCTNWADKWAGSYLDENGMVKRSPLMELKKGVGEGIRKSQYDFRKFIMATYYYVKVYPKYTIKYNCQHFTTNFFNELTGASAKTSEFVSKNESFELLFLKGETTLDKLDQAPEVDNDPEIELSAWKNAGTGK